MSGLEASSDLYLPSRLDGTFSFPSTDIPPGLFSLLAIGLEPSETFSRSAFVKIKINDTVECF